ncbi:MAG: GSCFA domain-containing protein [Acuticoccus sp.]
MRHPYVGLPDRQFWKKEPGVRCAEAPDPVYQPAFRIGRRDRIVTAGSCFAQHVAAYLSDAGFNHLITEKRHPMIDQGVAGLHNYGMFSARYGNVYMTRQLKQLVQRAYGEFKPEAVAWQGRPGGVVDPFRPQIQPGGFLSEAELLFDRRYHLARVREALEQAEVFVFTLGLTECWADTRDGAVFPLAPGVAGGTYDTDLVAFRNFDEVETTADLLDALGMIRAVNPVVKFILTVSPVPLNATYEDRHVLLSTTWSKAVLRIAAEKAVRAMPDCIYFPSYEVITAPHMRGRYYASDCREVEAAGVDHVMGLFFKHFTNVAAAAEPAGDVPEEDTHTSQMERVMDVLCDEVAIDNEP